jgi:hypothetical protein
MISIVVEYKTKQYSSLQLEVLPPTVRESMHFDNENEAIDMYDWMQKAISSIHISRYSRNTPRARIHGAMALQYALPRAADPMLPPAVGLATGVTGGTCSTPQITVASLERDAFHT